MQMKNGRRSQVNHEITALHDGAFSSFLKLGDVASKFQSSYCNKAGLT